MSTTPVRELQNKRDLLWDEYQLLNKRLMHYESIETLIERCGLPNSAETWLQTLERVEYYGDHEAENEFTRHATHLRLVTRNSINDPSNDPVFIDFVSDDVQLPHHMMGTSFPIDIELGECKDGIWLLGALMAVAPNINRIYDQGADEAAEVLRKNSLSNQDWKKLIELNIAEKMIIYCFVFCKILAND